MPSEKRALVWSLQSLPADGALGGHLHCDTYSLCGTWPTATELAVSPHSVVAPLCSNLFLSCLLSPHPHPGTLGVVLKKKMDQQSQ